MPTWLSRSAWTFLGKNVVAKLPWRCSRHFGGLAKAGVIASPNLVLSTPLMPPRTISGSLSNLAASSRALTIARVVERDPVRGPLVVDVGAPDAQHELLDPVGADPAGGLVGPPADAPRRDAGGRDLVGDAVCSCWMVRAAVL